MKIGSCSKPTTALHGFLGKPDDFSDPAWVKPDLYADDPIAFWDWAHLFNQTHSGHLVGYSLGGRLALHALIENSMNWESATLFSTHPGLKQEQRAERLESDRLWAEKFRKTSWNQLMKEWNSQPVFAGDTPASRLEEDYSRERLASSLEIWSLSNQDDLTPIIATLPMPIRWVVGEKDTKFYALGAKLTFKHPQSKLVVVPNCGHRTYRT